MDTLSFEKVLGSREVEVEIEVEGLLELVGRNLLSGGIVAVAMGLMEGQLDDGISG